MDGEDRTLGRWTGRNLRVTLEEIASPVAARMLARQGQRMLVIHAEGPLVGSVLSGNDGFFPKLAQRALRDGIQTRVVRAGTRQAEMMADPAYGHVHLNFGLKPGYAPNSLHVGPGPISGFWYLDEVGTDWHSSIRFMPFAPERILRDEAEYFFHGVTGWMLDHNVSILKQPDRVQLEPARATIFCQEIEQDAERSHFLNTEQIIRTVAEHDRNRVIYVKPHPAQSKPMRRDIMTVAQDYPNLRVTDASVHDLAAAADVVITQNSGAGFEALMQKKPVITCAKSDYWHATLTARSCGDLREAMDFAPEAMADFPYEKYFFWYLHRNLLEEAKDNFAERAWAKISDKAFI
ncbi:CDP-glycerol glycerophosphotransferase family protein [Maritimibacter sp. DP1N21-5]|uniref:capsular polysaccharide export protein, LipB/KpsS family n=1 Tax=Maritimibacter sp. DP1N21-5 TaxID=2836867 RepID=UPI001C4533DA|nr:CDP-glycerol glycerophosphotransferase family protein [Maritimibacter sp. DP1N21-5]MBV7408674.1 CDP-glycerol glycerophosphotransferase family protein [Maritimibacter sp. DP1N21-5]